MKTLNVDSAKLEEKIKNSGLKTNYIVEKLGLSRQGYYKKIKGETPFRVSEVFVLCKLLSISDEESVDIFLPSEQLTS